jgi:hypothetical protein
VLVAAVEEVEKDVVVQVTVVLVVKEDPTDSVDLKVERLEIMVTQMVMSVEDQVTMPLEEVAVAVDIVQEIAVVIQVVTAMVLLVAGVDPIGQVLMREISQDKDLEEVLGQVVTVHQVAIHKEDAMVLVTVMVKLVSLYSVTNYLKILWQYKIQQQITTITSILMVNRLSMTTDLI